tara:strand:- start:395 stop:670 length:276 start_codon:yes stop_codon:yes gene_type:complete
MIKELNLTHIDNENHGYIKLSSYDLESFEIDIKQFSQYSYYNFENGCYYFEEDCDGTKLLNILKDKDYKINLKFLFVDNEYFENDAFAYIN